MLFSKNHENLIMNYLIQETKIEKFNALYFQKEQMKVYVLLHIRIHKETKSLYANVHRKNPGGIKTIVCHL